VSGDLLNRLAAAGTPMDLIMEVAETLAEARAAERLLERQRERDRLRKRELAEGGFHHARDVLFGLANPVCAYCGDTEGPFHADHVIPLSRGGGSDLRNLTIACASCNISKGARLPEEWRA
jgi:5-methylcytosine-specific restriction endonuclease McrA